MKIISFHGRRLHGYLNIDISFDDQLTFLTGINGSGKTTALNAITALLFPQLKYLCQTEFDSISLSMSINDKGFKIACSKSIDGILLSVNDGDPLFVRSFAFEPDIDPTSKERETDYYYEMTNRNREHQVLREILAIPAPVFLGLDRRPALGDRWRRQTQYYYQSLRSSQKYRTINTPQDPRFRETSDLVSDAYSKIQTSINELDKEFRTKLFRDLIKIVPFDMSTSRPIAWDRAKVAKERLARLHLLVGISKEEATQALQPMLDFLHSNADKVHQILDGERESRGSRGKSTPKETGDTLFNWFINEQNLQRLITLANRMEEYDESLHMINKHMNDYTKSIDRFLSASGKSVAFNDRGRVVFTTQGDAEATEIDSLSSEEIQIFVLLSHLFFDQTVRNGRVFIIDEPELSLHVEWQELFVDSILAAAPDVQFIMATHSPSIILGRLDNCCEIRGVQ